MMRFKDEDLERAARAMATADRGMALIERFGGLTRESGSEDERTAARYIVDRLQEFGVPVVVHEPELYLSIPKRSELEIVDGGTEEGMVRCRPPAFARSTGAEGIQGELCYVASQHAGRTADVFDTPKAALESREGDDPVTGRVVLTEGYAMPGPVRAFERRGAVAQVYIHPGHNIHEGICTTIWGTPTPESVARKPTTPVVSVNHGDGQRLIRLTQQGPVRVAVRTWLEEAWMPCLLPVAEIRGCEDPDEFLLVHGHYDSWHVGIGDNATGDAALLELARVLHALRDRLKRSVRIAWWPGHSTGRYAGSTWYADQFADELDEWCIAHLNIDSPGCAGASVSEEVMWMAESAELCLEAIRDAVGEQARGMRPLRAGDYSFNQIGVTAFYMLLSNIPQAERQARGYYGVGGCGGSIVWHTPDDGPAVADAAILKRDLDVYLTTIVRVANSPLYPFDYAGSVTEMAGAVEQYREAAAGGVDLRPVLDDLRALRQEIQDWRARAERRLVGAAGDAGARRALNAVLRRLARILVPLGYARGERFDHDPALKLPPVARLEAAARLSEIAPALRPFALADLRRERNKVRAMIRAARRELV